MSCTYRSKLFEVTLDVLQRCGRRKPADKYFFRSRHHLCEWNKRGIKTVIINKNSFERKMSIYGCLHQIAHSYEIFGIPCSKWTQWPGGWCDVAQPQPTMNNQNHQSHHFGTQKSKISFIFDRCVGCEISNNHFSSRLFRNFWMLRLLISRMRNGFASRFRMDALWICSGCVNWTVKNITNA